MIKPGNHSTEIFITEGAWRVVEFSYHAGSYMSVQHYCTAGCGEHPSKKQWVGMHYGWKSMSKPCYVCNCVPPDGIQGVFALMYEC